jgi:hypothetical protein
MMGRALLKVVPRRHMVMTRDDGPQPCAGLAATATSDQEDGANLYSRKCVGSARNPWFATASRVGQGR